MMTKPKKIHLAALLGALLCSGCATKLHEPDLGGLYNDLAQSKDPYRNPVIVIPGILGSRLMDANSSKVVWGAFGPGTANPKNAENARLIALPMREGAELAELRDEVYVDGALDRVQIRFMGMQIQLKAYFYILSSLGVAGYRDDQLGDAGAIRYPEGHYTCFQYAYDWRRDIVESAKRLHDFIVEKHAYVQTEAERRYGIEDLDVKFDIVAHSMGGLVARYYLRYGAADLPSDGSLPALNWAGARYVENAVLIGTPNGGSLHALVDLIEGTKLAPMLPTYQSAILGTMPSMYQLLPRARHGVLVDSVASDRQVADIYDPELWERMGWGLADPEQEPILQALLPAVDDPQVRRQIALEHQRKALQRAKQVAAALDLPASPPDELTLHLVAGDAAQTDAVVSVDTETGAIEVIEQRAGDGTVLRSSALMDERVGSDRMGRLISPIEWSSVQFLFTDHLGLTKDPAFTDNLLYFLLEKPESSPH